MKTHRITLVQRHGLLFFATTLLAIVGVGCNTAHGFGKDMEKAGEKIQDLLSAHRDRDIGPRSRGEKSAGRHPQQAEDLKLHVVQGGVEDVQEPPPGA